MPEQLQEFCSSRGLALHIDRDAGLLRGVKLLGLASKNGREYPEPTLARAAPLYDGAKVNVNHPKGHPLAPRDYQDRLGTIRNVVARPGEGLFGDLQYNPKHALAEQLLWDAEHAPENVGFSHNVQARTAKRGDQTIVEEILTVQSVDLVADPATTRGLFESARRAGDAGTRQQAQPGAGSPPISFTADSPDQPIGGPTPAARHDLVGEERDSTDSRTPPTQPETLNLEHETIAEQAAEIIRLHEQVKTLQAAQAIAHKRAAIAALLVEHGLPPLPAPSPCRAGDVSPPIFGRPARDTVASAIVSESFIQSLLATPDEAALRTLVLERAALVEQARHWQGDSGARWAERSEAHAQGTRRPLSREQTPVESRGEDSLAAFVKAIRV
jgi:hypothetical protein